jgi:hypothetical protein
VRTGETMSQPPDSTESSAPQSAKRANDVYTACAPLSSDGAAAVLAYARTMLEKDRRFPPVLQKIAVWNFAWAVEIAACELKEGVYRKELVFIASVYRLLHARGDASAMSLAAFKARILEARHNRMMMIERCRNTTGVSPLLLEASATHGERGTYHLIRRSPVNNVKHALEHVTGLLPDSARVSVASFARRVHADEAVRDGYPRLITLSPDEFAVRIQQVVDREHADPLVTKLFWKLEDRGEMTGIELDSFKARLLVAHRAGRLKLGAPVDMKSSEGLFLHASTIRDDDNAWAVVQRSSSPPPIPWGPPARPIIRRLVLHAP